MKKQNIYSAAALAAMAASVILPVVVSADETRTPGTGTGEGKIEFVQGTLDPEVTPPGSDGPTIDGPTPNQPLGDLDIIAVTPLDFQKHKTAATGPMKAYFAKNFTAKATADGTDAAGNPYTEGDIVTTENFVKFGDIRSTDDHSYDITAQLTKQFTKEDESTTGGTKGATLNGATLNFYNVTTVTTAANSANALSSSATTSSFKLAAGADGVSAGDAVNVIHNTDASKGYGIHDIKFGNVADKNGATDSATSVQLQVPGTVNLSKGIYTAEITWTISAGTPGITAGATQAADAVLAETDAPVQD
jgi:hypothetical protein